MTGPASLQQPAADTQPCGGGEVPHRLSAETGCVYNPRRRVGVDGPYTPTLARRRLGTWRPTHTGLNGCRTTTTSAASRVCHQVDKTAMCEDESHT
eukprot:2870344-Rhodomonas_salina.3